MILEVSILELSAEGSKDIYVPKLTIPKRIFIVYLYYMYQVSTRSVLAE